MKKIFIWIGIVLLLILSIHVILSLIFGRIDYKDTISTKYKRNATSQTITTKHFEVETPKGWVHIFHGYGYEADAGGAFLTKHGTVEYEYGMFANPFRVDSINVFLLDSLKAGRFEIFIGRSENGDVGIHIPCQYEMELPFSFYMSKACADNLNDIIIGIGNMKFKKFYNFHSELDNAISYFKNNWSNEEIQTFKNKPEEESVAGLYRSVGLWIRNNWLRESQKTDLVDFFHSNGIYHPDDMSSIILTSLHRNLNDEYINLYEQVEFYKAYWDEIENCEEKENKLAVENFEKLNINDQVRIYMPVDTSYQERNAVLYDCPNNDWNFNPKIDLLLNGIIMEKYHINDSSNLFVKVRIQKMNYPKTSILMRDVTVGDTTDFSLKGLKLERL